MNHMINTDYDDFYIKAIVIISFSFNLENLPFFVNMRKYIYFLIYVIIFY